MERRSTARGRGDGPVRLVPTLVLALLAGCATEPEPEPTAVDVTGPSARLAIGGSVKLTAVVQGAAGPLTNARVTWASRDSATVRVDATGNATAVRPGETWVVGQAGSLSDSTLVVVEFSVSDGQGRARIRANGRESTLELVEPLGVQIELLGTPDDSFWGVLGFSQNEDTLVSVYFLSAPSGRKTMVEVVPTDTIGPSDPNATFGYLDIDQGAALKEVPLRGWVDAAVVQSVPAGLRLGRMRMRMIGSGRAFLGVDGASGPVWTQTQEAFDVVADALPGLVHETLGSASGELTGTTPAGTLQLRPASWNRTTAQGRDWLLTVAGPPTVRIYIPGTASVDLGTAAETMRAYAMVVDSARGYSGTATSGRVDITRYVAPPASDLYGEIRGRVTLSGTGTTQGGPATSFSGTIDFAAPVYTTALRAPPAVADPFRERARASAWAWMERRARQLPTR
jgi:hypothetical protein